jgi:hypothetical protein
LELVGDFGDTLFFRFAASVSEENEWYALLLEV